MKPEHSFLDARPIAVHCPALLRRGPGPEELLPLLTRTGERLARRLSGALSPMLGGEAPPVSCSAARESNVATLAEEIEPLAANSLFGCGQSRAPLLVSIAAEPILRIVDRAFGGAGEAPSTLPASFPMAAQLMIGRLEALFASHIAAAVVAVAASSPAGGPASEPPAITPLRREGSLALLAPFADETPLASITLEVDEGAGMPWPVTLAMPYATLARLVGYPDPAPDFSAGTGTGNTSAAPENAMAAPFCDVPLTLSAVIVDMAMPFTAISNLAVGQVLPVAVARSVPLRLGEHKIGCGTVGAVDEHVAILVTEAF